MKINDLDNLLEKADKLAEELDSQTAAGPELKPAKELENEATEEEAKEPEAAELDNKDVFPEDEHQEAEAVEPAEIKEEAENVATEEREPKELAPELDNKDVFPEDEHKDVKEEPKKELTESYTDADLFQLLDEAGYEVSYENLSILKEGLANGTFVITEDGISEDIPVDGEEPQVEDAKEAEEKADDELAKEHPADEKKDEAKPEEQEKELEKEDEAQPAEHAKELEDIVDKGPSDLELMQALKENGYEASIENLINLKEALASGVVTLVEEDSQTAAGPELKPAKELENEATEEDAKEPEAVELDNKDVFPEDEHKEAEAVEPAEIKEEAENATLDEMFDYLGTLESEGEIEYIVENVLNDTEYDMFMANLDEGFGNFLRRTFNGDNKAISAYVKTKRVADRQAAAASRKKIRTLAKQAKADRKVYEKGLKSHLKTINTKGMSKADKAAAVKQATDAYNKGAGAQSYSTMSNSDTARNTAQTAHDNAYSRKAYKNLKSELKQKSDDNHAKKIQQGRDNKLRSKENVLKNKGILEATDFELLSWLNENEYEPTLDNLAILKEMLEEAENVATEEREPEELALELDNKDVFPEDEHKEVKEIKPAEIKESEQVAAGPELKPAKELENEATEEEAKEPEAAELDNKDVFPEDEHHGEKELLSVKEAVELVIEAARRCKNCKKPATKDNLCEEAEKLSGQKDFAEKEYDADADIASDEMNGHGEPEYEKLVKDDEDKTVVYKSPVAYKSIKEACMLDENYFKEDSYTLDTAEQKRAKLTEQVSLLMAREAMDPMYDELLKTSIYAQRLQEGLVNKYSSGAAEKVSFIVGNKKGE